MSRALCLEKMIQSLFYFKYHGTFVHICDIPVDIPFVAQKQQSTSTLRRLFLTPAIYAKLNLK
eukprot:snap_masked-scaffold_51-processed-gene-1.30-mRNA-1 protein AED:1.00 eAED:1.00 QI:0/0/0/0/1/1/3/0/62